MARENDMVKDAIRIPGKSVAWLKSGASPPGTGMAGVMANSVRFAMEGEAVNMSLIE